MDKLRYIQSNRSPNQTVEKIYGIAVGWNWEAAEKRLMQIAFLQRF